MINSNKKVVGAAIVGLLLVALGGCHKEGPAEKAGKQVDKAVSSAGSQIEAAGDKIRSSVK